MLDSRISKYVRMALTYDILMEDNGLWSECWCGNRYIPGRNSDGECSDLMRHIKFSQEERMQTAPRCEYCGRMVPENPNEDGRGRPRKYCSDSCKTLACRSNRRLQSTDSRCLRNSYEKSEGDG